MGRSVYAWLSNQELAWLESRRGPGESVPQVVRRLVGDAMAAGVDVDDGFDSPISLDD